MSTRLQTMKKLAVEEAKKLKIAATSAEVKRLDLSRFSPRSKSECIYGMMTGDCDSRRASELIMKCASRVYNTEKYGRSPNATLNGEPFDAGVLRHYSYFSPIEMLIIQDHGTDYGKEIISFLKGETKALKL